MGLDMYLNKKTYVQNWNHNPSEEHHQIEVKRGGVIRTDIKPSRITYIVEQVGYWRKFNALHGWFVDNCGRGVDECQEIYVEEEKLEELLETLKEVSSDFTKSSELLPPTQGFFFGSDEVDEYYKQDVNSTIEVIEEVLKEHELSKQYGLHSGDFYYQASW
jgi:hypothetical protein